MKVCVSKNRLVSVYYSHVTPVQGSGQAAQHSAVESTDMYIKLLLLCLGGMQSRENSSEFLQSSISTSMHAFLDLQFVN